MSEEGYKQRIQQAQERESRAAMAGYLVGPSRSGTVPPTGPSSQVGAGSTGLPMNEAELKAWLQQQKGAAPRQGAPGGASGKSPSFFLPLKRPAASVRGLPGPGPAGASRPVRARSRERVSGRGIEEGFSYLVPHSVLVRLPGAIVPISELKRS